MFKLEFKSVPVPNTAYTFKEPSAAISPLIWQQLDALKDGDIISTSKWNTLYVLACIADADGPLAPRIYTQYLDTVAKPTEETVILPTSVEGVLAMSVVEFKPFLEWFMASIPSKTLLDWFELIDNNFIISKGKQAQAKND